MRSLSHKNGDFLCFTRARAANRSRRAVSIVELVIVVMVMSIMAAVAAPKFFETLLFHRVESAAHRLKADLELARHTARLTSAAQSLTFTDSSYAMSAAIEGLEDPNQTYVVDLSADPYEVGSVTADFNGTKIVSFDGYGTPSSSGTVVLTLQGHRATVTLNGTTGEVTITSIHVNGSVDADDGN